MTIAPDVDSLIAKAATLQEALPYIRDFHGAVLVVKYGGHAMVDPELQSSLKTYLSSRNTIGT